MKKYAFRISVLMMVLAMALAWTGKGQDGTVSAIIASILAYWFGSKQ